MGGNIQWQDTPKTLRAIANEVRAHHRLLGSTPPSIYVLKDGKVLQHEVPEFLMGPESKWMVRQAMVRLAKSGVEAVSLVSEAWMLSVEELEPAEAERVAERANRCGLAHEPNRYEALMICYNDPNTVITASAKIEGKKVQDWICIQNGDQDSIQGRFSNVYAR
jgi:hypothetical protein